MEFDELNKSDIKYVKLFYTDSNGESYEIKANINKVTNITLFCVYNCDEKPDIPCPQQTMIKIITSEAMYIAETQIANVGKFIAQKVDLDLDAPSKLERRQLREHHRIETEKGVVISCIDRFGKKDDYLAKTIDISAGGIKVTWLKSMKTGKRVEQVFFERFHRIVFNFFFDLKEPFSLDASFVRKDNRGEGSSYAFEFKNPNQRQINILSKHLAKIQMEQKQNSKF